MSNEINENQTEEIVKEIDLSSQESQQSNETPNQNNTKTDTINIIEKKPISKLTNDEKSIIIKNHLDGINQPYYDVKQFKNGNYHITKKKPQNPTIPEKVITSSDSIKETPSKVYYSDNQLLFEHIIDLTQKVDRLMTKHKKLKKKYNSLQKDIYIEEPEEDTENDPDPPKIIPQRPNISPQPIKTRQNWRSQITYL